MKIRRRGISDVITSLILILTTVSLATVFFFWALGYMGQSQSATGAGISQNNARVQEQFAINQVRFWCSGVSSSPCAGSVMPGTLVTTGDMVTIYIQNFGDIPITIDHIYFDGVLFQSSATCSGGNCFSPQFSPNCVPTSLPPTMTPAAPPLTVSARALGCINIQLLPSEGVQNWNVGETHTILAASSRGNQFTQSFTVPTQNWG